MRRDRLDPLLDELLDLERAALADGGRGDPNGYLALSAEDVTYFDPFVDHRLDGHAALAAWYAPLRGTIRIDREEFVAPQLQRLGDAGAVLTFQLVSEGNGGLLRWNCTEVYTHRDDRWQIAHSHWSFTKAGAR
jgi:ketosteroid isomerase-like protein